MDFWSKLFPAFTLFSFWKICPCLLLLIDCLKLKSVLSFKNVKLTHNSTPNGKRKVCDMILFIGGPVDWRAWETWMGDIRYRGRGCVTKVDWGRLRELRVWMRNICKKRCLWTSWIGWGPVDWVGRVLPEAKFEEKNAPCFFVFWGFERPLLRYLLKTV